MAGEIKTEFPWNREGTRPEDAGKGFVHRQAR
jgi:hypothetical protein